MYQMTSLFCKCCWDTGHTEVHEQTCIHISHISEKLIKMDHILNCKAYSNKSFLKKTQEKDFETLA